MAQIALNYSAAQINAAIAKINSLVTVIEGNIVQLYNGSTAIYPLTKAEAVFFDGDTSKTLDTQFSQLEQEIKAKSNIAFLNSNFSTLKVEGKSITIMPGVDIYGENFFFRTTETQIIESVYQGSGCICFDIESKTFYASDSVQKGALVVGMNSFNEILLYAKVYSYNGQKRGFIYSISSNNEFDKDSTSNPLSHNAFFLASYKNAISVCRGKVTITGQSVTIGKGEYYFYNKLSGALNSVYVSENIIFVLNSSTNNCLVFNIDTRQFSIKNDQSLILTDIICLFYDGVRGMNGGVWYDSLFIQKQTTELTRLDIFEQKYLLGLQNQAGNFVYTELFDVKLGDTIKWTSYLTTTSASLVEFNAAGTNIDQWTAPNNTRTITITNENTSKVRALFNFSTNTKDQSLYINNELKAIYKAIGNIYTGSSYFCRGNIYVNETTYEVTINSGDIYTPVKNYEFYRFSEPYTFKLDTGGTNFILYDYRLHTFRSGMDLTPDTCIIGVKRESNIFLNGDVKVTYSSGEVSRNYISNSEIKSIAAENVENEGVPSFVNNESLETYKRAMVYLDSQSMYLLAHITDVHSGGSTKYLHVGYLNSLNKVWGFSALCNAGDIGLDIGETEDAAISLMYNTKKQMNSTSPWLFCKGNHERLRSRAELGNVFMKPMKRQFPNIVFGDNNGLYGYIDNESSKVRTIYLNTSDTDSGSHYNTSDEQVIWLGNTLFSTNDDYKVVILTHLCPKQIGEWNDYPGDWRTASNFVKIIEGFAQRQIVSHSDTSWDYTSKLAKIVCVLSGDSHFNNSIKENGVNYVVRQGYGGISEASKPEGATSDSFNWNNQCLFDVLAIKDNSNAKIFRIGAGGESRDLELTF